MTASIENLKRLVEEAGLKQKDLASVMGVSESTVSRLLNGEIDRDISLSEAARVVAALQSRGHVISLEDLVGNTEAA